jgi:hypothetical protein
VPAAKTPARIPLAGDEAVQADREVFVSLWVRNTAIRNSLIAPINR